MPVAKPLKSVFNAGEFTPRLLARTDFDKYRNGVATLENMIPLAEGGATRRPGTRYVATAKSGTNATRLKSFIFSTNQAYILEFGDEYVRFYKDQGQITAGKTDAAVTNGTFDSDISSWSSISSGGGSVAWSSSDGSAEFTLTSSSDTAGLDQTITLSSSLIANEHILKFHLIGNAGDKIDLRVGTSSSQADLVSSIDKPVGYHCVPFTPNSTTFNVQFRYEGNWRVIDSPSSGSWSINANLDDVSIISNEILELQAPWGSSQLFELEGPQSADVLYCLHNKTHPYKLTRRGHTDWSLEKVAFQDGPYLDQNTINKDNALNTNKGNTFLTVDSSVGRKVTVTASGTANINDNNGFSSDDIGRLIRISKPSTSADDWGWGLIVGSTSTTTVVVDVKRDFPDTSATFDWRLGAWSDETGWPGAGSFHQQRLVLARSVDQPQTLWLSETGDFESFSPDSPNSSGFWNGDVEDDDAMNFTISSNDVESIEWMVSGRTLLIGTRAGEWEARSNGAALTPSDIDIRRHTQRGSARVPPVKAGHSTLFLQREKRRVRELIFDIGVDGLVSNDLTRLSPHITFGGIVEMAYQQEPDSILWAVRDDGQLLSMTYRKEEDVTAWGRHIMGGSYASSNALVKSIATVPGSTASGQTQDSLDRDELWAVVKRTINGSTVQYIEFMERSYEDGHSQEDVYYTDSLITYDGSSTTSITGASHLAAEEVKILANGAVHADKTASSSGVISLDTLSSTVQVGLGYTHRLKTLKLEAGAAAGTAQGQTKRISSLVASLLDSHVLKIGPSSSQLVTYDFREVADSMDTAVPFETIEQEVAFEKGWDKDPRVVIEDDSPVPFTILALVPKVKTNDVR